MHHAEKTPALLNADSLASHTFITGSTGSGKSNTIYKLLDEAMEHKTGFLVVEPAKGEYKQIFGSFDGVNVFGTNPKLSPLLKIDPFSFPDDIHVLEHIDRLTEIFCVCWPMYAAMPAVLKNAVQRAYEDCGWDRINSENSFGNGLYPSFDDVANNVRAIIDSSEYDAENKGAYKGSLLTRLESLTNGINGLIFTSDAVPDDILFDSMTIVDLSRVGSSETKSLIMGMLILKLQEYRISEGRMNSPLRHITVLEEAHNILRRVTASHSQESGDLLGKSVEMLSNAIAEMRTFGEGFIIADQAPELLDMSVIRNTNTKIILRLPDMSDRELVGKSADLTEEQITELAKLPCGVAAVYQNEWIEPVLCRIERFEGDPEPYSYTPPINTRTDDNNGRFDIAQRLLSGGLDNISLTLKDLNSANLGVELPSSVKVKLMKYVSTPPSEPRMTRLAPIITALLPEVSAAVGSAYRESKKPIDWTNAALVVLEQSGITFSVEIRNRIIQSAVLYHVLLRAGRADEVEKWTIEGVIR